MSENRDANDLLANEAAMAFDGDFSKIPAMAYVGENAPARKDVYYAGSISEDMLSDEERQRVDRYADEIDISNVNQVIKYGEEAQSNISNFSASVLKKVRTYDLDEVGESLKDLTIELDATTEPEKRGLLGLFQKAKRGVGTIRSNYAKAEENVNRIEEDLREHESVLMQDISLYQQMYELNIQHYKELTIYILAGKKALGKARAGKLVELKNKADATGKQEDAQAFRDYEDLCHRFEKKLSVLETTRMVAIQSAPQIRMLQNNDREMLDKLQSSIANTIPLWRNQLVLSLGIEHTKRSLEAQNALADKTNELLKKNSETLKMATVETAKASERPIVDLETLQLCNKNLITSIDEVVRIHKEGDEKRDQARGELLRLESELKQALLESSPQ